MIPQLEQRWLSFDGICNSLQTTRPHIQWLVKHGYLEMIPGNRPGLSNARFLDPTPQYAERLRLAEAIYRRRVPLPADIDISEKAIFTRAEIAQILGWSESYAVQYLRTHRIPSVKIGTTKTGGLRLYTAKAVRQLLWRRRGRKLAASAQKSPFLLAELIGFFLKHTAAAEEGIPTDADFAEDDVFQKKLRAILKMPAGKKELAMREMWEKVELAKQTVDLLRRGDEEGTAAES